MQCTECGAILTPDDIGFHKKMVNRGATEFECINCLCLYFGITRERAAEMIAHFRASGCTLFATVNCTASEPTYISEKEK